MTDTVSCSVRAFGLSNERCLEELDYVGKERRLF